MPPTGWSARLCEDLAAPVSGVGASQGRVHVPLPAGRRPTDWERNVAGLEDATWATADMAVRRDALVAIGGFDERFPRAYREDSDLGLRLVAAGWRIAQGTRVVTRIPSGPRTAGSACASRRATPTTCSCARCTGGTGGEWPTRPAVASVPTRPRALPRCWRSSPRPRVDRRLAGVAAAAWASRTAALAWRRIAPGPRTVDEIATMAATSAALPFAATAWWLAGHASLRRRLARPDGRGLDAVLLDRDGTLVVDVPYNGDPARVRPMPGARAALDRLRREGVRMAVVSNQSGIARGLLTRAEVDAVNHEIEQRLGPIGPWLVCPHGPDDGCTCRKPAPGLVLQAAQRLGVAPERCAVVGDIGADVQAAHAAGARAILVPTDRTLRDEIDAAPEVARDLPEAIGQLLGVPA